MTRAGSFLSRQRGFLLNPYRFGGAEPSADPNYANVSLLLHCDGVDASTSFPDSGPAGRTVTAAGGAVVSAAQARFGGASGFFPGAGSVLQVPSASAFDLGSTYTVEFFIRPTSLSVNFGVLHRGFYTTDNLSWNGLAFSIRWLGNFARFYFYGTAYSTEQVVDVSDAFAVGVWRHVAMVRNGATGYVYIDGVLRGSISGLNTPAPSSRPLKVGVWDYSANAEYFPGYLDEIRITKGVARYMANFTPPDEPFPGAGS